MLGYVAARLAQAVPVLFVVSVVAFGLLHMLPGDPVAHLFPIQDSDLSGDDQEAQIRILRERYGLDDPVPVQYVKWVTRAMTGDLGRSIRTREPVSDMIKDRFPVTAQLAFMSLGVALLVALPTGVIASVRRNSALDLGLSAIAMAGVAVPNFFLGMLLILLFSYQFDVLPPPGNYVPLWEDPIRSVQLMVLPSMALGLSAAAFLMRLTRSSLLEAMGQDYVRTARAKGLRERQVIITHALRNAMLPVVTVLGLQFVVLLGGTVIIEQIFALPGIGLMVIAGIRSSDFPVVQGFVLFVGVVVVLGNLLVDIAYGVLDPRTQTA